MLVQTSLTEHNKSLREQTTIGMKRKGPYFFDSFQELWQCSCTKEPMKQPMLAIDGFSYEKSFIQGWFQKSNISPNTGEALSSLTLIPNKVLKNVIQKFNNQLKKEFSDLCNQNDERLERIIQLEEKIKKLAENSKQYQELKKKYADLVQSSKVVLDSLLYCQQNLQVISTQNLCLKAANEKLKKGLISVQPFDGGKKQQIFITQKTNHQKFPFHAEKQNQKLKATPEKIMEPKNQLFSQFINSLIYSKKLASQSFQEQKPEKLRHFLPCHLYYQTCDFAVVYDEKISELDHFGNKINIQELLKHDWRELKILNLNDSQLDDKGLEQLVSDGAFFQNLTDLLLCNNFIQNIPPFTFERFPSIQRIYLSDGSKNNILTSQSIEYLKDFMTKKPSIQLIYE